MTVRRRPPKVSLLHKSAQRENRMRKIGWIGLLLTLMAAAVACSTPSVAAPSAGATTQHLNTNYANALPVEAQLAAGSLQLENGDLALTTQEAATLLPLWQALQALKQSDTAAAAEIEALVNQIQDAYTPEQIAAITDMQLTTDSLQELFQNGALSFGRGAFGGNSNNETQSNQTGGGFAGGPPGGFAPPEGGFVGGPGGGGFVGGSGGGNFDANDLATRRAERANGEGSADFQTLALTGAVIRLLEVKTGVTPEAPFGGPRPFDTAINAVATATGLSAAEIQNRLSAGDVSLRDIVIQQSGDAEAVRRAIVDALSAEPAFQGRDIESLVAGLYDNAFNAPATPTPTP